MPVRPVIVAAPLGAGIAAFICHIHGRPAAVINTATRDDDALYDQAAHVLAAAGIDAGDTLGALNGIRSRSLAQEPPRPK